MWVIQRLSNSLKQWFAGSIPFKIEHNYNRVTIFWMLMLPAQIVFLGDIYVFLQLSWIGLFEANRAYLLLETPMFQEVFLSKLNRLSQGNNMQHISVSNKVFLFAVIQVFLQLSWIGLFVAKWSYLHPETPKLQEVFLSETNSIVTGNDVPDDPAKL
jgi:hypothetical protein